MTATQLSSTTLNSSEPEILGIYRLESLLGRGGMGEVYLAWDQLLERHVAIKRIRSDKIVGKMQRARFLREARAVARLDHPAIIRIYHILEREDGDCLVMEHVDGRDLTQFTGRGGIGDQAIDLARAVDLARQVALGLAAAHAQGLVHRDLKPANVMVTKDWNVKILDFGLAKALFQDHSEGQDSEEKEADSEPLTEAGMLIGTIHAMSPEQAASEKVDHRSDLFALGSLLYELLSGRAPFRGSNTMDSLRRIATGDVEPIDRLVPQIPRELSNLISTLHAHNPAHRPASALLVADRLAVIAANLGHSPKSAQATSLRNTSDAINDDAIIRDATVRDTTAMGTMTIDDAPTAATPSPFPEGHVSKALRTSVYIKPVMNAETPRRVARGMLPSFGGSEKDGGYFFQRPASAVAFALALQNALRSDPKAPEVGLGIGTPDHAAPLAERARSRQILVDRGTFDFARGAQAPAELVAVGLRWLVHGTYLIEGEPLEICEVGLEGYAPLINPEDSSGTERETVRTENIALGWRPAAGQPAPQRPNWNLVERLGEGGFGEVWLARHKSDEERVFKFCFDAVRLRALKREVTLFRLLRETLGHRRDIARVLDWNFTEVPYFLESEYTDGGDLERWAKRRGGLANVPLATRLELIAMVAEALAAAHSVGVLHKDVKPGNVLIGNDADGRPEARLADFGIAFLAKQDKLNAPGFTVLGYTETSLDSDDSTGGTVRYMAPELLEGKPASIQADIYSLGVVLYQIIVGDFERAMAPGWRRDVDDPLLMEDIAACVDGAAEHRLRDAGELAQRLRMLDKRRKQKEVEAAAEQSRLRAVQRRKIAGWLGITAAILLLVISGFAYQTFQAKNRELEARQNSEQRRQQAEKLLDFVLGDLRAELQPLGKLDILDKVGDQAMEYFSGVPDGDLSDEEMANYATALHQIGKVRFDLGKMPEAAVAFEESLALAKELAARSPENTDWQFELGQSHFWLGYLRWQESDLDRAYEQMDAYRSISTRLVERDPENATWQLELAYSQSTVGQIYQERGRFLEASSALESSARVFESLILRSPEDEQLRVELAHVYTKLGAVLQTRGELSQARSRFEASLELMERASAARPENIQLWHDVNAGHYLVAIVLLAQGEDSQALNHFRRSLEGSRRLVEHDSENRQWQSKLMIDLLGVTRSLVNRRELAEATRLLSEVGSINEALLKQDPDRLDWRLFQAIHRQTRAEIRKLRGFPDLALSDLENAASVLQEIANESESLIYQERLASVLINLGEAHQRLGNEKLSNEFWQQAVEMTAQLTDLVGAPDQIALHVRVLLLLDQSEIANSFKEKLTTMGYRNRSYQDFLDRFP